MSEESSTPSIIYPLSFGLRNPNYTETLEHIHSHNPGKVVDMLDPRVTMLLSECQCGERELITLEESSEAPPRYRYRCSSCMVATEWSPSRAHAKQLWDTLQQSH